MENNNSPIPLSQAVESIKTAILQGQYEALKDVNRVQLAVYFAIGKFLSGNTRKGVWGTGALKKISEQLRKELPGLRGYSETNLKNMRLFYDHWQMLDSNSSVATDELISAIPIAESNNSSVTTDEFALVKSSVATKTGEFKSSYLGQLMTYLRILDDHVKKPHENPSIGIVLCKSSNKELVEYVIQDYHKPMGVATYKTSAEMPENLRKALPDEEQLRNLLSEN